jgi:beta-galactosidase
VEVVIVDAEAVRVPSASDEMTFAVEGDGKLVAVDNPDPMDISPVQATKRKAYRGRALAIVRAGDKPGRLTVTVTAAGMQAGKTTIVVK